METRINRSKVKVSDIPCEVVFNEHADEIKKREKIKGEPHKPMTFIVQKEFKGKKDNQMLC
jgi:hypothetical protein